MEFTEQERLIAKQLGFVISGGQAHPLPRKDAREIGRQLYALASHDEDAKQLVFKLMWSGIDIMRASERGWGLAADGKVFAGILNFKNLTNEEAAERVKQLAQDGDVLAQKTLIESARRQLTNGNSTNDAGFTSKHY